MNTDSLSAGALSLSDRREKEVRIDGVSLQGKGSQPEGDESCSKYIDTTLARLERPKVGRGWVGERYLLDGWTQQRGNRLAGGSTFSMDCVLCDFRKNNVGGPRDFTPKSSVDNYRHVALLLTSCIPYMGTRIGFTASAM
ncbi:unnamed protein product [Ectocarpus sp. 12 AP-2014]